MVSMIRKKYSKNKVRATLISYNWYQVNDIPHAFRDGKGNSIRTTTYTMLHLILNS